MHRNQLPCYSMSSTQSLDKARGWYNIASELSPRVELRHEFYVWHYGLLKQVSQTHQPWGYFNFEVSWRATYSKNTVLSWGNIGSYTGVITSPLLYSPGSWISMCVVLFGTLPSLDEVDSLPPLRKKNYLSSDSFSILLLS